MNDFLFSRRTIRLFQQQPLKDKDLETILEAARQTSSAANNQPLRYIVARTPELAARIFPHTLWAARVKPHRTPIPGVSSPMAYILVLAPEDNAIMQCNAGMAMQSMQLAAWSLGIGSCSLGAIDRPAIAVAAGVPSNMKLFYVVALGYPAEAPVQEDVSDEAAIPYYLDGNNVLHVPKLALNSITTWK